MSLFRRSRVTEQDRIVLELKNARDMIQQSQQKIDLNLEKERQLANKSIREGMNEKALRHLKKMRDHKQKLVRLDGELEKLEKMISKLDFYKIQAEVEDTLKKVKENLKRSDEMLGEDQDGNADVTNMFRSDVSQRFWIWGAVGIAVLCILAFLQRFS